MVDSLRAEKPYRIGIIGDKSSLVPFWELFANLGNERVLGQLGLVALALHETSPAGERFSPTLDLPVYAGWREMMGAHPEISMVIETTGQLALIQNLRLGLPPTVALVERAAAARVTAEDVRQVAGGEQVRAREGQLRVGIGVGGVAVGIGELHARNMQPLSPRYSAAMSPVSPAGGGAWGTSSGLCTPFFWRRNGVPATGRGRLPFTTAALRLRRLSNQAPTSAAARYLAFIAASMRLKPRLAVSPLIHGARERVRCGIS